MKFTRQVAFEDVDKKISELFILLIDYNEKCWFLDGNTSVEDPEGLATHPQYGDIAFNKSYLGDRLLFSGTETSQHFGGYMEGAVISGIQMAERFK